MSIQNVIFDIGNIFIKWAPLETLCTAFPGADAETVWQKIHPAWIDLNLGRLSLESWIALMNRETGLPAEGFRFFCDKVMSKSDYLADADDLQRRLKEAGLPLYALTDNIKEAMAYHRRASAFMQRFDGAVVSADVGFLKPDLPIYRALFETYGLSPSSCVFFDDVPRNVEGARQTGMKAFVYTEAAVCEEELRRLGLIFAA